MQPKKRVLRKSGIFCQYASGNRVMKGKHRFSALLNDTLDWVLFPRARIRRQELVQALHQKTVLITGASYGIGEACALFLSEFGTRLILTGRTSEKLHQICQSIKQKGGNAEYFACDFSSKTEVDKLNNYLLTMPYPIDIIISNAGKSIKRSVYEIVDASKPYSDYEKTMEINYHAPVRIICNLLANSKNRNLQIINISAINVLLAPAPNWSAYQASKTAFDQWLRCITPELSRMNIFTTTLYLPLVKTRMIEPTKLYTKLPAMRPAVVAKLVAQAIAQRPHQISPWWSFLAQMFCLLFSKQIRCFFKYMESKQYKL